MPLLRLHIVAVRAGSSQQQVAQQQEACGTAWGHPERLLLVLPLLPSLISLFSYCPSLLQAAEDKVTWAYEHTKGEWV